MIPKWCNYYYN